MPAERSNGKVKRPPNAWILFRSDIARALAQEEELHPELPRRTQAQISKEISYLWSILDPERKAEYERRAEAKKHEHTMLYPDYRFQPMKKEEKERQKQLKKQRDREERYRQRATEAVASSSRAQSVNPSPIPPAIPLPTAALLLNHSTPPPTSLLSQLTSQLHLPLSSSQSPRDSDADPGPSPPLCAADSPCDTTTSGGDSRQALTLQLSPLELPPAGTQNANEITQPLMSPRLNTSWTLPSEGDSTALNIMSEPAPTLWEDSSERLSSQPGYLTLDIPPPQNSWNADGVAMFDESLQALLTSSGDPSIFHLNNVNPDMLDMGATLDISVGDVNIDLSMFSYAEWADVLTEYMPNDNFHTGIDDNTVALNDMRTPSNPLSSHSTEYEDDLSRYIDLDGAASSHQPSLIPAELQSPPPQTHSPASETLEVPSSRSTYAPPVHSSQRRPGGTWKPPATFGEVTVQPWKVRAN
ncbi:hypothetical protein E1B28_009929 [Marasmius oreades]|uniref:HMG box domain-containing protein n=1 Tax=Marasmius oreades TaxID=181124 RepID=A0A9P7RWS0_9AGAR|nr:uncharacterized protein E1B28_009929 [Marasmius oreades]KAG7090847.1 hypothetical protein E1B28_009929 [Marasmius oreades]